MTVEHLVTPAERLELREAARHWPPERRRAIAEFVCEVIDKCPRCGGPVRRNDSRAIATTYHKEEGGYQVKVYRVGHLRCVTGRGPELPQDLEPL